MLCFFLDSKPLKGECSMYIYRVYIYIFIYICVCLLAGRSPAGLTKTPLSTLGLKPHHQGGSGKFFLPNLYLLLTVDISELAKEEKSGIPHFTALFI